MLKANPVNQLSIKGVSCSGHQSDSLMSSRDREKVVPMVKATRLESFCVLLSRRKVRRTALIISECFFKRRGENIIPKQ